MVKCDICGWEITALSLTDHADGVTFTLCPNHLLALVTHSLKKEEALKLIQKYGSSTFYLHEDFYADDGTPIQPMFEEPATNHKDGMQNHE